MADACDTIRVDRWLWFARFFKTRALATKLVSSGRVRLNSDKISKPAHMVGPGDTLTFTQADTIKVVRIIAVGARRGPAVEAQALYEDLTPIPEVEPPKPPRIPNRRPTKKERRAPGFPRREVLD
ncbi:MAG: S4 domain-containing protein [Paracoccaceae bacterium]